MQGHFYFYFILFCLPLTRFVLLLVSGTNFCVFQPECALCVCVCEKLCFFVSSCKNGRDIAALLFMSAVFCCAAACVIQCLYINHLSVTCSKWSALLCILLSAVIELLSYSYFCQTLCDCPYCFRAVQFSRIQFLRQLPIGCPISPHTGVIVLCTVAYSL